MCSTGERFTRFLHTAVRHVIRMHPVIIGVTKQRSHAFQGTRGGETNGRGGPGKRIRGIRCRGGNGVKVGDDRDGVFFLFLSCRRARCHRRSLGRERQLGGERQNTSDSVRRLFFSASATRSGGGRERQ